MVTVKINGGFLSSILQQLFDNGDGSFTPVVAPATGAVFRQSAGYMAPGQSAKAYTAQYTLPSAPAAPAAPTVATGAGALTGTYIWRVTFVSANGETQGGTASAPLVLAAQGGSLTAIPLGPVGTTARKIYRTLAGGIDGSQQFVATIADNTTTVYVDNIADATVTLAARIPSRNTWTAALVVPMGTVTTSKIWIATDISVTTDGASSVDVRLQAGGVDIFRALAANSSPVNAAGIETQPSGTSGQALQLVLSAVPGLQTVDFSIGAIEQ